MPPPPNQARLNPYLSVKNFSAMAEFYTQAFGFTHDYSLESEPGMIVHAEFSMDGEVIFMAGDENSWPGNAKSPATSAHEPPISLAVYVDDIAAFHANAVAKGAKVENEPTDEFYGDRVAKYRDPSGYAWSFHQHIRDMTPDQIRDAMMKAFD